MRPIVVITHVDRADIGLVEEIAEERGHELHVVRPYRGDRLPEPTQAGAVIVLGGPQSAYDEDAYLRDEERFLVSALEAEIAILAICLGAQLLARATGGSAHPGDTGLEWGLIAVKQTDGATIDVAGEYFSFHSDSMTPPAGADLLGESDRYLQAWTLGSALALQFHPEITLRGIDSLVADEGPKLERFGVDVPGMQRDAYRYFAQGNDDARRLLHRWFDRLSTGKSH